MAAAGKPDTKNLELKGKTWWCVKTVPPSLRDRLPTKLRKNLQTSSLREAQSRRAFALAHFEAEIRQARNTEPADPIEEEALKFREYDWSQVEPFYETWKGEKLERDPKEVALSLAVDRLEHKKTPAKDIERFVDIATSTKTPVLTYLEK